jgi:hypothetical protein
MNQRHILQPLISSAIVASAVAVVSLSASAQTTTTTTTAPTTSTTAVKPKPTSATDQMIQEACQRSKARRAKFLQNGTPEQFGSEEPFTFDPKAPGC